MRRVVQGLGRYFRHSRKSSHPIRAFRPGLESLEDRTAPAVFTVNTAVDEFDLKITNASTGAYSNADGKLSLAEALYLTTTYFKNGSKPTRYLFPGPNTINFNIKDPLPADGFYTVDTQTFSPFVIRLYNQLTINGYSQPGSRPNTLVNGGSNEQILIAFAHGVAMAGPNNAIRGLSVGGVGIANDEIFNAPSTGNVIAGNDIGLYPDGTNINSQSFSIFDKDGAIDVGGGSNTIIGGPTPGSRNVISFGPVYGVSVGTGVPGTVIQNNVISFNGFSNPIRHYGGGGIYNPNVAAPVLTAASPIVIAGTIPNGPGGRHTLQFYSNTQADFAGVYEGQNLLWTQDVTTDAKGAFKVKIPDSVTLADGVVVTYIDTFNNQTSPFSNGIKVSIGKVRTWTGKGNGAWSDPNNWLERAKPASGNDLIFPKGAPVLSVNDLKGLILGNIQIDTGYSIRGNAITLTGGINDKGGASTLTMPISLSGAVTITVAAGAILNDTVALGGTGNLIKAGAGTLKVAAINTYAGSTILQAGAISVPAGSVKLGTGALIVSAGNPVLAGTPLATADSFVQNAVQLNGGTLVVGGHVRLDGQVTVNQNSAIVASQPHEPQPSLVISPSIMGAGVLTLAGTGGAALGQGIAAGSRVTAAAGSNVIVAVSATLAAGGQLTVAPGSKVSYAGKGTGSIMVEGGLLTMSSSTNLDDFKGTITLHSGTVDAEGNPKASLSGASLIVHPIGLAILKSSGVMDNPVQLQGGTLVLGSSCTLKGPLTVSLDTQINGPGSLHIQGTVGGNSKLTLVASGELLSTSTLNPGPELIVAAPSKFVLDGKGSGAVTVKGGTLQFGGSSFNFTGPVALEAGTIRASTATPLQPLGAGTLTVRTTTKATLEVPVAVKSIPNSIVFEKGAVVLKGPDLPFSGQITVKGDTEIDATGPHAIAPQVSFAKKIGGGANLTIVGPGRVSLAGITGSARVTAGKTSDLIFSQSSSIDNGKLFVDDGGTVFFSGQGAGPIDVTGGTLDFLGQPVPGQSYTGTIQLLSGTVKADGGSKAALSGATLIVKPDGKATLAGTGKEIDGPTQLQGGTLNITGSCIFSGQVSVLSDTQIAGSGSFHLAGQITGSKKLTLTTSSELTDTATLNFGSTLIVSTGATLVVGGAKGSGSVIVDGGTMRYAGMSHNFFGLVTLQKGKIQSNPSTPLQPFGATLLQIRPTGPAILEALGGVATVPTGLAFQAGATGGSITLIGDFDFKGLTIMKQATGILLVAGDDVTFSGDMSGGLTLLFAGPGIVRLKGNIGDTRITAGPQSTIILMDGFVQSDNGIPKATGGGVVVDKRTK